MKKILFGLLAGISAGILFAPKSGKRLRTELRKSESKFSAFGQALLDAAKGVGDEAKGVLDSKEVKDLIASGKKSAGDLVALLEAKSEEMSSKARKELEGVLNMAIKRADETAADIEDEAANTKKRAAKKAKAVKKQVAKKADSTAKQGKKTVAKKTKEL